MDSIDIHGLLIRWGYWHRNFVRGLGYKSRTVESQIQSGVILGDGNKGGGYNKETVNQVSFKEDKYSETLDFLIKHLRFQHRDEMDVIRRYYVDQIFYKLY